MAMKWSEYYFDEDKENVPPSDIGRPVVAGAEGRVGRVGTTELWKQNPTLHPSQPGDYEHTTNANTNNPHTASAKTKSGTTNSGAATAPASVLGPVLGPRDLNSNNNHKNNQKKKENNPNRHNNLTPSSKPSLTLRPARSTDCEFPPLDTSTPKSQSTTTTTTTTTSRTRSKTVTLTTGPQCPLPAAPAPASPTLPSYYYRQHPSTTEPEWGLNDSPDVPTVHSYSPASSIADDTISYSPRGRETSSRNTSRPVSPRWDESLARDTPQTFFYEVTHAVTTDDWRLTTSSPGPSRTSDDKGHDVVPLLISTSGDDFPRARPRVRIAVTMDNRAASGDAHPIENFSRPRRPSIKQPSPEPVRTRPTPPLPPSHPDSTTYLEASTPNHQYHLWPRERGLSISSNKSTSTFNSIPHRPSPDLSSRDNGRGRSRHVNPPLARQHMAYYRTESSGPTFSRDPIPRMASMPSDELRSSFRSQLSASTAQGTYQTERSSVLTKTSSITSIYGPVDDGLSVDDVMGMYEKGFRDDSPARTEHDDASRPPTGRSEMSRRRTAILDAMNEPLILAIANRAPAAPETAPDGLPNEGGESTIVDDPADDLITVRESAAIFQTNASATSRSQQAGQIGGLDLNPVLGEPNAIDTETDLPARTEPRPALRPEPQNIVAGDETRDRYGFRKKTQYITQEQYDQWNSGYSEYIERRRKKWHGLLKESGLMTDFPNRFPQRSAKTKRFVRKGIPPEWRGAAWFYYSGGPAILAKHGGLYDQLVLQQVKEIDDEAIERDLHRTFPDNIKFRGANAADVPNTESHEPVSSGTSATASNPEESPMISSLRRVLRAFSIYNPRIGYCQSLNFLAGLLLLFVETEEQAFWLLNIITRVYLPGTHEISLEGANVDLGVLMTSLRDSLPAVWANISGELDGTDAVKPKSRRHRKTPETTRLPPVTLCMTSWFMNCFIGVLPIETTLRVWDIFFYEGSKTLFRIALAIFKVGEAEIHSVGDPMEIFQVVQTIPRRLLDANALLETCFRRRHGFVHLSQETIEHRRRERRAHVKLEKERIAAGSDEAADSKRKNILFGRKRRPAEIM